MSGLRAQAWSGVPAGPWPPVRRRLTRALRSGSCTSPLSNTRVGYRGGVRLPFDPPIAPMLAKPADALPEGDGWLFEPKWDGFRALVFRDGDETLIQSRDLKPLDRYFPELAEPLRASPPARCLVD